MIIKKILVFLFVFAILNILANIGQVVKAYICSEEMNKPLWQLICLGISISYFFTIICTGGFNLQ